MKKRILVTTMALAMAFATATGSMGTLTVHAKDYDDGCWRSENEAGGGGGASLDTGSGSSGGGSSSGGSGSSGGGSSDSGSSYDSGSGNSGSGSGGASYSAPAPKVAGTEVSAGKEKFRAAANAGAGTYKVTHKGIEIATFTLMDADKKAVPCTAVNLKQREDGKWAINYQVTVSNAETTAAADTTGLTVGAPLDRTYMYNTLGVSYVTINDNIVIDIEAEAAAK